MKYRVRIIALIYLRPDRILPNPKNFRTHPEAQRGVMLGALADVGIGDGLKAVPASEALIREVLALKSREERLAWAARFEAGTEDVMLLDGHLRAEEIRDQPIPVLLLDLLPHEQAEFLATYDPIGDLAGFDRDKYRALAADFNSTSNAVQSLVADLAKIDTVPGLELTGDEEEDANKERQRRKDELAAALASATDGAAINPTEELRRKWGTERGQLWLIAGGDGREHRLLCGDSTSQEDVARLMGGIKARLLDTDAPYGIDYSKLKDGIPRPGFKDHQEQWGDIENDTITDGPALQAFLERMIRAALPHLELGTAFYFWHPMLTQGTFFAAAAAAADILIHRQIIWVKPGFVLTRSGMYHWKHELCFYGWIRGQKPAWYGDKGQTSVWTLGRDEDSGMHPTQKPVALWVPAIMNHTQPGDCIYEPFSGSGGQLIAAEQTGRVGHAMELEPKYVAVALERLSQRGLKPRLAE